jgi:hypothetical protein
VVSQQTRDRPTQRGGAINDRCDDARRNEGEGCQQADVPFALGFMFGNLVEGGDSTEPDIVDPSPGLDDCSEQDIAALESPWNDRAEPVYAGQHGRRTYGKPLGTLEAV